MTLLKVFEAVLVEINKVKAPSLLLDDFNYFANKAQIQLVNKYYNHFEINQQRNDDLRALKNTVILELEAQQQYPDSTLHANTYVTTLPDDYFHLLNCIVEYNDLNSNCENKKSMHFGASRINSDQYPTAIRNYYLQPSWKRPYYFINKVVNPGYLPSDDKISTEFINRIEIRIGKSTEKPSRIYVDYLQTPQTLKLTEDQLDEVDDNSQIIQFPEYICYELINEIIKLVLENSSDPRLQTNIPINQSIGTLQSK